MELMIMENFEGLTAEKPILIIQMCHLSFNQF